MNAPKHERLNREETTLCKTFVSPSSFSPSFFLGPDLGHPADAAGHRGPNPGLHGGGGGDQSDPVGGDAARLDRHLLQQEPGDPKGLKQQEEEEQSVFGPGIAICYNKNLEILRV